MYLLFTTHLIDDIAVRVDDDAVLHEVGGGFPRRRAALSLLSLGGTENAPHDGHRRGARQPHDPHRTGRASGGGHNGGDGGGALGGGC